MTSHSAIFKSRVNLIEIAPVEGSLKISKYDIFEKVEIPNPYR